LLANLHYEKDLTMKRCVTKLLVVAVALAGVGWTDANADDQAADSRKELEKFAGTWQLVASEKDGVKAPEAEVKQTKVRITGDKFTMERAGKTVDEGWICFDPARKPKAIDIYPTESKVVMGIYEWDGDDKLRVCSTHPGTEQARPTLFSTTKGSGHVLHVCQRVKTK
jgi:uncharacterized protein (TIGR03067 family)